MADYRLYCLDAQGHILERAEFQAEGDEQAIAHLDHFDPDSDRELWQDHRKVTVLPARQHQL